MASFLDSLFGSFTGQPAIDAANAARGTLQGVYGGLIDENRGQRNTSLGELEDYGDAGRGLASEGFERARGDLIGGASSAINMIGDNYLDPLQDTQGMLSDAQGLNGPGGSDRAQAAFRAGPGYEFMLDQGLDAITRNANAGGMLASGNMLRESQQFGSGLANQEWQNWMKNLQGRESLYAPLAERQADFMGELGRNLGTLDTGEGQLYHSSFNDEAQRRANLRLGHVGQETGAAGIFGPALASTNLAIGAAQQQGGANSLDAIGNVLTGVTRLF